MNKVLNLERAWRVSCRAGRKDSWLADGRAANKLAQRIKISERCPERDGSFVVLMKRNEIFILVGTGAPTKPAALVTTADLNQNDKQRKRMQKITPFLWFDDNAEEAVKFYASIFKNSKIKKTTRYEEAGEKVSGRPAGSVMTIEFQLNGQEFVALNGGPQFKFTEAVSFVLNCKSQAELDHYWKKLSAGGKEVQCGWLKDKYGLSWQIVPTILGELFATKDAAKSHRVMQAMLKMVKLDIKKLKAAAKEK